MTHPAQHINQSVKKQKRVYLVGTASTTYYRGEGVAYNRDYGTATTSEGSRDKRVEPISTSNHRHFAGVLNANVTLDSTGEGWVTINEPGSVCAIALGADTVIDTTILGAQAGGGTGAGRFSDKGFIGRGAARALQTVTGVLESVKDGTGSLDATDGKTLTVSDSSDFTVGDTVVMLACEGDGTGVFVAGKYLVGSITDATTIVLAATCLSTLSTGSLTCSYYVYTGNPTALAYLYDGTEETSGCVTWISPPNAGDTDYAPMLGGISYINGGVTLAADFDIDLPDETIYGAKIGFVCMGTMTTNDVTVDLDTGGIVLAGTALAEINAIDAAADACYLQWTGLWRTIMVVGGATEA